MRLCLVPELKRPLELDDLERCDGRSMEYVEYQRRAAVLRQLQQERWASERNAAALVSAYRLRERHAIRFVAVVLAVSLGFAVLVVWLDHVTP